MVAQLGGPATRTDPGSIVPGIHLRQWCQSSIMSSSEMSVVGSELYVSSLSEPYVSSLSELYVSSLSELYVSSLSELYVSSLSEPYVLLTD